jgi:hypothetical protein
VKIAYVYLLNLGVDGFNYLTFLFNTIVKNPFSVPHAHRVKFNLRIGSSGGGSGGDADASYDGSERRSSVVESGLRDESSNSDGKSYGWVPGAKMSDVISKGGLRLVVDMHSVNTVSDSANSYLSPIFDV